MKRPCAVEKDASAATEPKISLSVNCQRGDYFAQSFAVTKTLFLVKRGVNIWAIVPFTLFPWLLVSF